MHGYASCMDTQKTPYTPMRPLYSLSSAAQLSGLSVEMLKASIDNGDIPGVRILHLGPHKRCFVRSRPFIAWLEGYPAPTDPGPEADAAAECAVADDFDPTEYNDDLFN